MSLNINCITGHNDHLYKHIQQSIHTATSIDIIVSFLMESGVKLIQKDLEEIKDKKETKSPENRPPYIYQVPLSFIPGVGGKTVEKLLSNFETEMNVLHKVSEDDIEAVVGAKVAKNIMNSINGNIHVHSGGGGVYGKVEVK